jgi:Raf kinase inhibitor-like YbhB/YbcL family protein
MAYDGRMPNVFVRRWLFVAMLAILPLIAVACGDDSASDTRTTATPKPPNAEASVSAAAGGSATAAPTTPLVISSPAFADGADIPRTYTCDGSSDSPPLEWTGAPAATKSLALIMHDPDAPRAGGFTHWVVYDIPPGATKLNEGASPHGTLPTGTRQGENSARTAVYTPPCPPSGGGKHHYTFTLYALDANLGLDAGKSKEDVEKAVTGHILGQASFTGLFGH